MNEKPGLFGTHYAWYSKKQANHAGRWEATGENGKVVYTVCNEIKNHDCDFDDLEYVGRITINEIRRISYGHSSVMQPKIETEGERERGISPLWNTFTNPSHESWYKKFYEQGALPDIVLKRNEVKWLTTKRNQSN